MHSTTMSDHHLHDLGNNTDGDRSFYVHGLHLPILLLLPDSHLTIPGHILTAVITCSQMSMDISDTNFRKLLRARGGERDWGRNEVISSIKQES